MPWEKSFDEEETLNKAMKVFWEKGFKPTSMADLIASTGITRGSLYNAFGGKEKLFIKALKKYDKGKRRSKLAALEGINDPLRAITALFDGIVADTIADPDKKGCFIINTASDLASHGEEVNQIVRHGLREIEAFFRRSIEVAQARRQISETLNPEVIAKGLVALATAIRVLGRGVYDKSALNAIASQAQRLIR